MSNPQTRRFARPGNIHASHTRPQPPPDRCETDTAVEPRAAHALGARPQRGRIPASLPLLRDGHVIRRLVAALVFTAMAFVVVVLAAACGDDDGGFMFMGADDMAAESAEPADFDGEMMTEEAEAGVATADFDESDQAGGDGSTAAASLAVATAVTGADLGRDIIYRATITVETEDVDAASREATRIVAGFGGIVFGQETRTQPTPSTTITFKVFPADFSEVLDRLAGIGELVDQRISADDVTERIVDIESRILTAEASLARLRNFLAEATELDGVAQIEREMLERETTLETLRGQLRTLQDQIDLATVTLTIVQSPDVLPESAVQVWLWASDNSDDPCQGTRNLITQTDSEVWFCLEVENRGEAHLTNLRLRSEPLRLAPADLGILEGNFNRLDSGERLVATWSLPMQDNRLGGRVATRGLDFWVEVSATPLSAVGEERAEISGRADVSVELETETTLPGLGDSVNTGVRILQILGGLLLVLVGVFVPFLPLAVVVGLLIWVLNRRSRRRSPDPSADAPADTPPAPPAPEPRLPETEAKADQPPDLP